MNPDCSQRIAVAVSGGADSLFALYSLKQAGHEPVGLHGLLADMPARERTRLLAGLERTCRGLDIPLVVEDLRTEFAKRVIEPFINSYITGYTPNPCVLCNSQIKFGLLFDKAMQLGADFFATGHYASLVKNPYGAGNLLAQAKDCAKDQSYFLAMLSKDRLDRLLFPVSAFSKKDILKKLQSNGLDVPGGSESQDICFAGGQWDKLVAYRLETEKDKLGGNILLRSEDGSMKIVGSHSGLWRYTRGQRRGLGICGSEPYHVLEKRPASRQLVIGSRKMLHMTGCLAKLPNFFVNPASWPDALFVKTRFRQPFLAASVEAGEDFLRVKFAEKAFPSSEGQTLAIYDSGGRLLAGALIEKIL